MRLQSSRLPRGGGGFSVDIRTTLRSLVRRPVFAFTAVLTIALGVGATTAVFSAVDAILLRPLPFAEQDRLVAIMPRQFVAGQDIEQLRERMRSLDEVAVFSPGWLMPLLETDEPRQVNAARVSGNMFSMIGTPPLLGRPFGVEAERAADEHVAILGFDLWRDAFKGDSAIVGRSVLMDGERYRVVAVMRRGFQLFDWKSDLWVPMSMSRESFTWTGATGLAYGRLRAGKTLDGARTELRQVIPAIRSTFRYDSSWGVGAGVLPLLESLVGNVSRMMWILFGSVMLLLLIATGNVANLLLVRASERRAELALRSSLGARIMRIARLLIGESLLLGIAGGVLGVGFALIGLHYVPALLPPDLPRLGEIAVNGRMLTFALVVTLLPSLAIGLAPLLQVRAGLARSLRESRGGAVTGERLRGSLVSLQVALSLALLVGASIMGRSLISLLHVERGLRSDHLLTASVMPAGTSEPEALRAFWREALRRVSTLPGVSGAATILHLPTIGRTWMADIDVVGRPSADGQPKARAAWQVVSTGYFATAGVPILSGRPFVESDNASAPRVVAVNAAFAARMFPGESPLGREIIAGNATRRKPATIIAVVGGVRHDSLSAPPAPEIYLPFEQTLVYATGLIVRTNIEPATLAQAVRERIWSVDRNVPITDVRSMDDRFSASLARPRLILRVLGAFAVVGLILGTVGIYGTVAFGVQQRRRELGIRAAIGAEPRALRALVVRGGVRFALIGVVVGLPAAFALSLALRGMVSGVSLADPLSFVSFSLLLVLVAGAASWYPARRAARSDPMMVLRED